MKDIPLHDIKGLVEVPDNSFLYLLMIIGVIVAIVLIPLIIWMLKKYKKNRSVNLRKEYLQKIHSINTQNAKEAAYEMSKYGRLLAESAREIEVLESLDSRLEKYKYKKDVEKLDDDTLAYYQLLLEVLDAS